MPPATIATRASTNNAYCFTNSPYLRPAEHGGLAPQAVAPPQPVQAGGRPGGFILLERIAEVTLPSAFTPTRVRAGAAPRQLRYPWRRTESPSPSQLPGPSAFQAEPAPWPVHPPRRRAENSNPTARTAHSLAARPGTLTRSLSIEARRGIEPAITALQAATNASWVRAMSTPGGTCTLTTLPGHWFLGPARLHSATSAWSNRPDSNWR